jgi:hypothetical protein
MAKDINGTQLAIGDNVYYARKNDYSANGQLVKCVITDILENGHVHMGKYKSTDPQTQILKA